MSAIGYGNGLSDIVLAKDRFTTGSGSSISDM